MFFSPADITLWLRCRRQWIDTCQPEGDRTARKPAFPVEMTGEAALRETARVVAESVYRVAPHAENVHARSRGTDAGPPTVDVAAAVLNRDETLRWVAATMDAIRNRREFVHGLLLADPGVVVIDHGVYHTKIDAWEFSLFRPATGIRGVYYTEGALIVRAADMGDIPLGGLHLWYLRKNATVDDLDATSMEQLYVESNILKRSRRDTERVGFELEELLSVAGGETEIERRYKCAQRCSLCEPRVSGGDIRDQRFNIRTLHKGGEAVKELARRNIRDLRDIPQDVTALTDKHRIQVSSVLEDRIFVDQTRLAGFLQRIEFPVFYLDFEAFATSVPYFPLLNPYGHTPVVASIHVQRDRDSFPEQRSYIAANGVDDRMRFFNWLVQTMGESGSIVVFSRPFESAMVRQLAGVAGKRAMGESIVRRMVDLLEPFADFMVYHPDQWGKVSLKRVLPAFTDVPGYQDETVQDGMHANLGLIRRMDRYIVAAGGKDSITAGAVAAEGVTELVETMCPNLVAPLPTEDEIVAYCAVDTIAMYHLIRRLEGLAACGGEAVTRRVP